MTEAVPRLLAGRYRLGRRLGRGGMSEVHRAVDTRLGRPVAVKVFRSNADESARRRFEDEARLLAGLSHPGLVTVHDFGAESGEGEPYLVMQLVEGRTLANVVEAGPVDPVQVLGLGGRLAEVLAYVHANGIVHRDVKPSNVLITEDGQVFLADFGISRLADTVGRMTDSGIIMGSAHYMAPEQVRDQEIGYSADLYSLALVLLECLTGRAEYDGTKAEAAVARLTRRPRIPESLPEPLAGTLRAMTADDPGERPSAARCARMLAGEISPPEPADATSALPAKPAGEVVAEPRRRNRWTWPGILAVAVVLGAVFLLLPMERAPDPPVLPPATGPAGVDRLPADLANLGELVDE